MKKMILSLLSSMLLLTTCHNINATKKSFLGTLKRGCFAFIFKKGTKHYPTRTREDKPSFPSEESSDSSPAGSSEDPGWSVGDSVWTAASGLSNDSSDSESSSSHFTGLPPVYIGLPGKPSPANNDSDYDSSSSFD